MLTPAGTIHAGCSSDQPLVDLLHELRTWLDAHPDDFVLLYLENALDGDPTAHAEAVAAIRETLGNEISGSLVEQPLPGGGCQELPVDRTKREILVGGAQVLITGNCGPGAWTDWVFERGDRWDESGGSEFDCPTDRYAAFDTTLVRRYEDSTWLSAMAGSGSHRDADTIEAMVRCGVNLVGFDQLYPDDERLPRLVWSWRTDQPSTSASGQCAAQGTDGRFFADDCNQVHPVACRTASGGWAIGDSAPWADIDAACQSDGHLGAGVPVNGWDNEQLRLAAAAAGASDVWLAYAQNGDGAWVLST